MQPAVKPHRFSVRDWHRMGEIGLLAPDQRAELIEGEIIDMAPIGSVHAALVTRLNHLLTSRLSARALVSVQNPLRLGDFSEPQPDLEDFVSARLRKYEQLPLARLFILQGRVAEALELLDSLLALARQLDRVDLQLQVQILRARACQAAGRDAQAMAALTEALSLAEPGGYLRTFLDEGELMRLLISDFRFRIGDPAREADAQDQNRLLRYAEQLLAAFPGQAAPEALPSQDLVEPLSERELEVLRLLATGLSNPEIADELVIAVSTVRSHCKNIYGKLDVHKPWDAVQRAQELGVI